LSYDRPLRFDGGARTPHNTCRIGRQDLAPQVTLLREARVVVAELRAAPLRRASSHSARIVDWRDARGTPGVPPVPILWRQRLDLNGHGTEVRVVVGRIHGRVAVRGGAWAVAARLGAADGGPLRKPHTRLCGFARCGAVDAVAPPARAPAVAVHGAPLVARKTRRGHVAGVWAGVVSEAPTFVCGQLSVHGISWHRLDQRPVGRHMAYHYAGERHRS
jgi:hypothetical protein